MKKLVSVLLALAFVFSVTACGNYTANTTDNADATASADDSTDVSTNASADAATSASADTSQVTDEASSTTDADQTGSGKILVVYYSATGSTKGVAEMIAEATGADVFEITPVEPYTSADLDWSDENSRVSVEHNDESKREVALTKATPDNWEQYDTVFVGYPIWWGIAAWPVDGFISANDFTGKTVIPFCTSASSGIGQSGERLAKEAGTGDWLDGERFSSGTSASEIESWVNGLGFFGQES